MKKTSKCDVGIAYYIFIMIIYYDKLMIVKINKHVCIKHKCARLLSFI